MKLIGQREHFQIEFRMQCLVRFFYRLHSFIYSNQNCVLLHHLFRLRVRRIVFVFFLFCLSKRVMQLAVKLVSTSCMFVCCYFVFCPSIFNCKHKSLRIISSTRIFLQRFVHFPSHTRVCYIFDWTDGFFNYKFK